MPNVAIVINSILVTSVVEEEGVKYPPPKTPLVGDDPEPNVPNFGSGVMSPKSDEFPVDAIVANSIVLTNPDGDTLYPPVNIQRVLFE